MAKLRRQRGFAMILVMAMVAMGSTWMVLTRLNQATTEIALAKRAHNAKVLARAKEALVGYVAAQANKEGENNPGNLPCPENPGNFDNAYQDQGLVGTHCGTTVKVGRFPWRTLGLDKLVDADGEALWYVVSPNWGYNIGSNSVINSDSVGQLTVDGVMNAAVALIIAPGATLNVQAVGTCAAWSQTRPTTGTPDWRNYLECENASSPPDVAFVTTGPSGSFNDQVLAVTATDVLPALEAAVADRIQREVAPVLGTVYTAGSWGLGAGTQPVYPLPAAFSDPGTASYRGMPVSGATTYAGLLPVNYVSCSEGTDARCAHSTFLAYSKGAADVQTGGSGSIRTQSSCGWQSDTFVCTGEYFNPTISVQVTATVSNVAMGLRTLNTSSISCTAVDDVGAGIPQQNVLPCTPSVALESNGSLTITVSTGDMPDISASGWGTYATYSIRIPRAIFGDHELLRTTTGGTLNPDISWFMRNGWYKQTYYAVAGGHTAAALPADRACVTGTSCLTVSSSDPTRPISENAARVLLVLAGRSLSGSTRPNATLSDYLEGGNATGSFIRQVVSRNTFNDRVVVVSSN